MNRTWLLIVLLIVSAAGLMYLALNTQTPPKTTVPVSLAQTTLLLSQPIASTSGVLSSDVLINSNGNLPTAVQIELSYDPTAISNVDVKSGPFFANPVELIKKIDSANGRVSYAVGVALGEKGASGSGIVAVVTFTKVKTSGTTTISFLPKSLVTSQGISQSVLKSATSVTFDLSK